MVQQCGMTFYQKKKKQCGMTKKEKKNSIQEGYI